MDEFADYGADALNPIVLCLLSVVLVAFFLLVFFFSMLQCFVRILIINYIISAVTLRL